MRYSTFSQWLSRFGLHSWMKVSNMAIIMKLLHLRTFSSLLYCVCRRSSIDSWRPLQRQSCGSQSTETAPTAAGTESVESSDCLPPARLASLIALLWRDTSQDSDSDIAKRLTRVYGHTSPDAGLPIFGTHLKAPKPVADELVV